MKNTLRQLVFFALLLVIGMVVMAYAVDQGMPTACLMAVAGGEAYCVP